MWAANNMCCKTGEFNPLNRHNCLLDVIAHVLRELGVAPLVDEGLTQRAALDTYMVHHFGMTRDAKGAPKAHHRPDAIFRLPQAAEDTILDVNVGDFRDKATGRDWGTPLAMGEAALAAEQDKTKEYESAQQPQQQPKPMTQTQLVAASITNMGAPSKALVTFLQKVAQISSKQAADRAAGAPDGGAPRTRGTRAAAHARSSRRTLGAEQEAHRERTVAHIMARITAVLWREQAHAILSAGRCRTQRAYGFGEEGFGGARRGDMDLSRGALLWAMGA
jgi:hypothetical protein